MNTLFKNSVIMLSILAIMFLGVSNTLADTFDPFNDDYAGVTGTHDPFDDDYSGGATRAPDLENRQH